MGWQDIVGAADFAFGAEDIIGAANPELDALFSGSGPMIVTGANPLMQAGQAALAQNLAARHAAMVVPRHATKAREYPLGFPRTTIVKSTSTTIKTQPQVPFRGRRLIVPSDIAASVLLLDIKVGKNSMFPTSDPVPGRAFTELGVGVDLNLDTAQISQIISLSVENTSAAADIDFTACLIGTAVE